MLTEAPASRTVTKLALACRGCGHFVEDHRPIPLTDEERREGRVVGRRVCHVPRPVPEGGWLVCGCVLD